MRKGDSPKAAFSALLKKERIIDGGSASGGGGGKIITHRPERVRQKKNKIVHQGILRLGIFLGRGILLLA